MTSYYTHNILEEWREKLVGTIRLLPRDHIKKCHCADVVFMFVRTQVQKHGIGRMLLDSLIERAREMSGLEQLELSVSSDSLTAIRRR